MSDSAPAPTGTEETTTDFDRPSQGDAAFADLMDTLAPEDDSGNPIPDTAEAGADAGAGGQPAAVGQGAAADRKPAAEPAAGDAGKPAVPAAGEAAATPDADPGPRPDLPADWTRDASELIPELGELSTRLEDNTARAYHAASLADARTTHAKYFEAIEQHPRLLVGLTVPKIGGQGEETLADTNDAREWQDAVKSILVEEVKAKTIKALDENKDFLNTIHASIELFQNNTDLIPGTKGFDSELANQFADFAQPYELRVDGKLQGYTIQTQPIINKLRDALVKSRASTEPPVEGQPAAGGAAPDPAPSAAGEPADPPNTGIQSKAGNSGDEENFDTLWGTLGIEPGFRV